TRGALLTGILLPAKVSHRRSECREARPVGPTFGVNSVPHRWLDLARECAYCPAPGGGSVRAYMHQGAHPVECAVGTVVDRDDLLHHVVVNVLVDWRSSGDHRRTPTACGGGCGQGGVRGEREATDVCVERSI